MFQGALLSTETPMALLPPKERVKMLSKLRDYGYATLPAE